jgi:hypothetical protein
MQAQSVRLCQRLHTEQALLQAERSSAHGLRQQAPEARGKDARCPRCRYRPLLL